MATDSNGAWWDQYKELSSSLPVQSWSAPTGADSGAGSAPVSRGQSLRKFGKDALGVNLSWTDLEWCVKQPGGGKKQVLFGLNGLVRSGEMLAVLGPSGSGKSTLLDILAMRKTSGHTRGFVRVNGLERKEGHFNRASAYVPQDDVFLPTLTVEETLVYYAELVIARAPRWVKLARITEVLRIVGLERSRRTKVGGSLPGGLTVRGCSGGERKRLNLATAMLARPSLIFIDEPTSGLDAFASLRVLETIRGLSHGAAGGPRPAVVVTVHQPRSAAWQIFEEIYLMSEGHLIYAGPAEKAAEWFDSLGFGMCHTAANPADWLVDLVTLGFDKGNRNKADEENTIRSLPQLRQAATHFAASPRMAALKSLVGDMVPIEVAEDELWPPVKRQHSHSSVSTHASFLAQFQTLLWRHSLSYRRNVGNVAARVGLSLSCGLLVGISYYGLGDEVKNIPDRLGVLFFICMTYLITPCASMSLFVADRRFYAAEAAAQLYGALPYYMAVAVCETVVNLVCAVIFWSIVHPMANFRQGWLFYFQGAAISGLLQLCGAQITNLAALVTPNQELAFVTAIAYQVTNYVSAGYLVRTPDLPVVARWFRFLSPCKYGFQALASNEYAGKVMDREARLRAMKDAMGPEGLGSGLLYWARMVPGGESMVDNTLGTAFMSMDTCLTGMFHSGTEALACVHLTEPSAEAVMYNASFMIPQLLVGHILGLFALKVLYPERR